MGTALRLTGYAAVGVITAVAGIPITSWVFWGLLACAAAVHIGCELGK